MGFEAKRMPLVKASVALMYVLYRLVNLQQDHWHKKRP